MTLPDRCGTSRQRTQTSSARPTEVAVEGAETMRVGLEIRLPSRAALKQARALSEAIARLSRALAITAGPPASHHLEHAYQVALLSYNIAHCMGLGNHRAERIFQAAYLHDVGSAAVPTSILLKPEPLTAEERATMQVHPIISRELLAAFLTTKDLAEIALSHHERVDGDGYPSGYRSLKIPLEARVLTIADSLDAMMSRRPYREAISLPLALEELKRGAGRQFDANIVELLARKGTVLALRPITPPLSK
jgi:HD-GYP domain-containing protein (c-di-GMP phosphodiesterase class II)